MPVNYRYIYDDTEVIKATRKFENDKAEAFRVGLIESAQLIGNTAVSDFMTRTPFDQDRALFAPRVGDKLNIRTSRLSRSLTGGFTFGELGGAKEGIRFFVRQKNTLALHYGTKVPYGAIHEFGGVTPPRVIRPKKAKMLRFFNAQGAPVFARVVRHPGSRIPARPYLGPAAEKSRPQILRIIQKRTQDVINKLEA